MTRLAGALAAVVLLGAGAASAEPILQPGQSTSIDRTSSGQAIVAPSGPLRMTASIVEIAAGAQTPEHQHPYPRFGYVLSGRLEMENRSTGAKTVLETGDFTADPTGQWHLGRALDGRPVRLLVIDQTPQGVATNTVPREGK